VIFKLVKITVRTYFRTDQWCSIVFFLTEEARLENDSEYRLVIPWISGGFKGGGVWGGCTSPGSGQQGCMGGGVQK
jgi:hypothetical protein